MYEVQHESKVLREGRSQDGPPYPKRGGVFVTHSRWHTFAEALDCIKRKGEWQATRFTRSEYRIVQRNARGHVLRTFDAWGNEVVKVRKTRVAVAA